LTEGKNTTIIADLARANHIPSNTFECVICCQTLQCIYDVKAEITTLSRILKPGGVLLATFPGITQTYDEEDWSDFWYWNFTRISAQKLLVMYLWKTI
jgi:ubiquinone/menaquinone biosynthesis C-methylase UbiE